MKLQEVQVNKVGYPDNFNNITQQVIGGGNKQRRKRIFGFQKERVFTSTIIAVKVCLFVVGIKTKSLHTAQNAFVFNLAITDLFTLFFYLPLTVYKHIVVR